MSKYKPTDDELLSYVIGDSALGERKKIEQWLELTEKNRSHLKTILFLKNEIQKSPVLYRKKNWKYFFTTYATRAGALMMAFIAGLWIQAHWQPMTNIEKRNNQETLLLSEPLSLETQPSGKFL